MSHEVGDRHGMNRQEGNWNRPVPLPNLGQVLDRNVCPQRFAEGRWRCGELAHSVPLGAEFDSDAIERCVVPFVEWPKSEDRQRLVATVVGGVLSWESSWLGGGAVCVERLSNS